jgi:hypothetical protein
LPFGIKTIDQHLAEGGLALGALPEVAGGGNGAIDGAAAALPVCSYDHGARRPNIAGSGTAFRYAAGM